MCDQKMCLCRDHGYENMSNDYEISTYVDHAEDVLEGHVGEEEEESAVDVHHALLVHLLAEVDYTEQQRDELKMETAHVVAFVV